MSDNDTSSSDEPKRKRFKPENTPLLLQYYNKVQKSSPFSNIVVKVQTHVYHLDKVILALKSVFFEKLFTADFDDRKQDEIEIHSIEEETFLSIIEHIYGADLPINELNFAMLFIAMDYLQMNIDVQNFIDFIVEKDEKLVESEAFKLYHYVSMRSEFEPLIIRIRRHFSQNLDTICGLPEFLLLTPTMLIEILSLPSKNNLALESYHMICSEWICHDFQNRLPCIVDLVNAVKYRFGILFTISSENYKPFEEPDEQRRKERVKKYFYKLLTYNTETKVERFEPAANDSGESSIAIPERVYMMVAGNPSKLAGNPSKPTEINSMDTLVTYDEKWKAYLEHGQFCDISVQTGDEIFQLHRIKLSMEIPYFRDLLSQSPNINHHTLDAAIDGASFKEIVKYIYCSKEIELADESQIHRLFRSSETLQMKKISKKIYKHVIENWKTMIDNVVDILPSVLRNGEKEHCEELTKLIEANWEEICEGSRLTGMSFDALEFIVSLPGLRLDNEHSLLNICCKWIHHDVKNRYQFIPELALAINRNSMADYQEYSSLVPDDLCSEQQIENQLQSILLKTQLVSTSTEPLAGNLSEELTPCFVVSNDHEISVVNAKFDKIISIPFSKTLSREEFKNVNLAAVYWGNVEDVNLAAALMGDNLFMLSFVNEEYSLQVYNLHSKKITSLTFFLKCAPCLFGFCLLNYNNELYFCADTQGENDVLKYSYRLNRWVKFPLSLQKYEAPSSRRSSSRITYTHTYASDGKTFYRFSMKEHRLLLRAVEAYNFENQSWIELPVSGFMRGDSYTLRDVMMVDGTLYFLLNVVDARPSSSRVVAYQRETQTWQLLPQCGRELGNTIFFAFKCVKDSIVFITSKRELYFYSITDKKWQMKKELRMEFTKSISIHSIL